LKDYLELRARSLLQTLSQNVEDSSPLSSIRISERMTVFVTVRIPYL